MGKMDRASLELPFHKQEPLPKPLTASDALDYLRERPGVPPEFLKLINSTDSTESSIATLPYNPVWWMAEDMIVQDLIATRNVHASPKTVNQLRQLLYAVGQKLHEPRMSRTKVKQKADFVAKSFQKEWHAQRTTEVDESLQEDVRDLDSVIKFIKNFGVPLDTALTAIERLMEKYDYDLHHWIETSEQQAKSIASWKDVEAVLLEPDRDPKELGEKLKNPYLKRVARTVDDLDNLRPLRDAIYERLFKQKP